MRRHRRRARAHSSTQELSRLYLNSLPSQTRAHFLETKFRGFSGPVGSGKSRWLCEAICVAAEQNRGRTGLLGAPTYPMLRDATLPTLFEVMNGLGIRYELQKSSMVLRFVDWGTRLLCRAVENFDRLRGTNLAFFALDEASYCPEMSWMQLEARLRDPLARMLVGLGCWTPKGHNWLYKRFVKNPLPGYACVLANPMENTHLPADFYANLLNSYSPEFAQQEVLGRYLNVFQGRAYASFLSEGNGNVFRPGAGHHHQSLRPCQYDASRPILWALDFNVSPATSVIAQTIPQREGMRLGSTISGQQASDRQFVQLNVLDEIYLKNVSTYQHVEAFWKKIEHKLLPEPFKVHIVIYGDASGKARHSSSSESDYQIITEFLKRKSNRVTFEIRVPGRNPEIMDRVNSVNAMCLTYRGTRRLCVHSRCKELILDLDEVQFAKDNSNNLLAALSTADAARTHISDALGYLIYEEFGLRSVVGEQ